MNCNACTTPSGLNDRAVFVTQGSRCAATLGFVTQPLWGYLNGYLVS